MTDEKRVFVQDVTKLRNDKHKNRRKISLSRACYKDAVTGLVFLPPKSLKRVEHWKKKLGIS